MFYKKGIDITNDKQMFNFIKNHFEYYTMNSWNRLASIANNVKLHRMHLTGDWTVAYNLLVNGEYETVNDFLYCWAEDHPGYDVGFNGRSGGYLVLTMKGSNRSILPDSITDSQNYEEYKEYCKEYYGSVKANRQELRELTQLIQDFDRLCDELRDFCESLSQLSFERVEMEKAVEQFNDFYADDLKYLGFHELTVKEDGSVNIAEIYKLTCLAEAFIRLANRKENGYKLAYSNAIVRLELM
jgi:hypothetical protein